MECEHIYVQWRCGIHGVLKDSLNAPDGCRSVEFSFAENMKAQDDARTL